MKTISAQENGTKFQEKIVSCVELNCRHQAKSIFVVNLLHTSIYVDCQLYLIESNIFFLIQYNTKDVNPVN